jgi:hypothetical protein
VVARACCDREETTVDDVTPSPLSADERANDLRMAVYEFPEHWPGQGFVTVEEAIASLDAERARYAALVEAAQTMVEARDAWLTCMHDDDDCGARQDVAFDALRAALPEVPGRG